MPEESIEDLFATGADSADEEVEEEIDENPEEEATSTIPPENTNRLTTGIDALDRNLAGGLPPGRLLTFLAPADTQSELLVKQLAAEHDCLYLSTLRPKWEVEEEVSDFVQRALADRSVVNNVKIEQLKSGDRLDDARQHIQDISDPSIVIVDSINELEDTETDRYVRFLDNVKERLWETGSVGVFFGIESQEVPKNRSITLRRADMIWQLRRSVSAQDIEHLLVISKFRSGRALSEPLKLELTDEVGVDTSRDIA